MGNLASFTRRWFALEGHHHTDRVQKHRPPHQCSANLLNTARSSKYEAWHGQNVDFMLMLPNRHPSLIESTFSQDGSGLMALKADTLLWSLEDKQGLAGHGDGACQPSQRRVTLRMHRTTPRSPASQKSAFLLPATSDILTFQFTIKT